MSAFYAHWLGFVARGYEAYGVGLATMLALMLRSPLVWIHTVLALSLLALLPWRRSSLCFLAAGFGAFALVGMALADWQKVMAANVDSAFAVTQLAAERLLGAGRAGAIVNVASIEGYDPAAGHAHYASSKAAMLMLTKACALEYGRSAIRVNAVSPGLIERAGLRSGWPEGVESWLSEAPLGRLGSAADVADAVLFLLSPAARFISGANLVVDGGMSTVSRW